VVIEVWDTGIGIPAEQAERVFEEFYQVSNLARDRSQGTGLGLAIVKRLSALLGGTVTFSSRPGKGTVFRFAIPTHGYGADEERQPVGTAMPPGISPAK
jgi:two-component system, sensor histidine kinase